MIAKTLVAGIGNIFNTDDGFGSEVAQRLSGRPSLDGVRVEDYGIRGVHLAYELLEGYDLVVLIDALPRGEPPGTLFVFEPDVDGFDDVPPLDSHQMDPRAVLGMVAELGGEVGRVLLVGCEPADVGDGIGLSPPVAAVVDDAATMVEELVSGRRIP
ncbi:MAG: hydrogenase maturation protease [Actinomycetota bacterium]|nr:hydrogenase maturation protease [Actinomycetota bacterium]